MSEAVLPALSVAVSRIVSVPTSALAGVPVKTPVAELNVSHVGSGSPLVLAAVMVSGSPASSSPNALDGTVRLNAAPWVAVVAADGAVGVGRVVDRQHVDRGIVLDTVAVPSEMDSVSATVSTVPGGTRFSVGVKTRPCSAVVAWAVVPVKLQIPVVALKEPGREPLPASAPRPTARETCTVIDWPGRSLSVRVASANGLVVRLSVISAAVVETPEMTGASLTGVTVIAKVRPVSVVVPSATEKPKVSDRVSDPLWL